MFQGFVPMVWLLAGAVAGAAAAWLVLRARGAVLAEKLARTEESAAQADAVRRENESLKVKLAEEQTARAADREKLDWIGAAQQQLRETFKALAADALRENAGQVLHDAGDKVVKPLETSLAKLEEQVRELESKRAGAYQGLLSQLGEMQRANSELARTTATLSQALQSSNVRGRWGELQLRRVVELAGMQRHVDFTEQEQKDDSRPDLVVRMPGGGVLPIDAKTTMSAYLEALGARDEETRKTRLAEHADALRRRIRELGEKQYWKQFTPAPEFVVMFVPIEASLSAAFEQRPDMLEYAFEQRVLLTAPVTMLALLKAIAFGWQQQQVAGNIKAIEEECREFYARLMPFLRKLGETGAKLDQAVQAYNAGVGSLQARILPAARRLKELGAGNEELPEPKTLERRSRPLELDGAENGEG